MEKHEDYVLKNNKDQVLNLKHTKDVFDNDFDTTWFTDAQYLNVRSFTLLPGEERFGVVDDGSITYNYNDQCFRSDNFKKEHGGKHILFAGCSQTEGVGGNIEDVWTKMFNDKISDSDGFYTIARAGFGWQKVITNFLVYIQKYGIPEYLFVLLPNVSRMFVWSEDRKHFMYEQKYPAYYKAYMTESDPHDEVSPSEYRKNLIDFKISWNLFEKFCESIGTKMLWSTWESLDNDNLELFGPWNSFIRVSDENEFKTFLQEYSKTNKIKNGDMKRRDGHLGTIHHIFWTDRFYNEAKARWDI